MSCTCEECIKCCWHSPGWFGSIEEIEGAAALLNISVEELCKEYLIVEYFEDDEDVRYNIPVPRKDFTRNCYLGETTGVVHRILEDMYYEDSIRNSKGFVRATWGHNLITGVACIFLKDDRCIIHESKPYECKVTFACRDVEGSRQRVHAYWMAHQDWVDDMEEKIHKETDE